MNQATSTTTHLPTFEIETEELKKGGFLFPRYLDVIEVHLSGPYPDFIGRPGKMIWRENEGVR